MRKIAGYRVMINKTQKELAEYLSISRQAYSDKERGKVPFNDRSLFIFKLLNVLLYSINCSYKEKGK